MMASIAKPTPYGYRSDPSVPDFPDDRPIMVFDGYCVLCSSSARFVLRHDKSGRFRLLPAQTPLGRAIYVHYGLDPEDYQTNILIQDGMGWFRSESSIRIAEALGLPWSLMGLLRILPLGLRDWLYDRIAHNRFRLFGRQEICYLAEPGQSDRFLS